MARTNIDLDDRLVEEGLRVFKCKTKKELIHLALQELLKTEKRKEILKVRGRVQWEGDLEETRRSRVVAPLRVYRRPGGRTHPVR
jgi:Arc/MetJ family transcription regulator